MSFQQTLNRNFTTGFLGDVVRDGPSRAKPARIVSATTGADPGLSTNKISRAFGYSGEQGSLGGSGTPTTSTYAGYVPDVIVGGAVFFGVLGHPKHYALLGDAASALDPTMNLPQYINAEFFDMSTGLVVELFNETTAVKNINYGDGIAYVPSTIIVANNPLALPYGALVSVPAGGAAPTGFVLIPNARIQNAQSLVASAAGALVVGNAIAQLTQ